MKLATLQAGQFVETGGYYTKGDAGAARYLIKAAQAADEYGDHTLANGTVAVLQILAVMDIRAFGVVGDGATSDADAFKLAIESKVEITIEDTLSVRIEKAIVVNANVMISGGGKILLDVVDIAIKINTGDFTSKNINYDGNGKSLAAVWVVNADTCEVTGGSFKNFDSDTWVQALIISNAENLLISGVSFTDLTCLSNGVIGDANGAVRAIYISGTIGAGLIDNCVFDNINNRDGVGALTWEDADAINTAPLGGTLAQNITVSNNLFNDCGKRAVKLVGNDNTTYYVDNNHIISTWIGTPDNIGEVGNGMYGAIDCFGGFNAITNNRLSGGVCGYFVVFSNELVNEIIIDGNSCDVERHEYANGSKTRAFLGSGVAVDCKATVTNNIVKGYQFGVENLGTEVAVTDNILTTWSTCVSVNATHAVVANNLLIQDAGSSSTTASGVSCPATLLSFAVTGNIIKGFQDGVNINGNSATRYGQVSSNVFQDLTRNGISDFSANPENHAITGNMANNSASNRTKNYGTSHEWRVNGLYAGSVTNIGWDVDVVGATSSTIANVASLLNTVNKREGKITQNTNTKALYVAAGSAPTDPWWLADGSASVTPA